MPGQVVEQQKVGSYGVKGGKQDIKAMFLTYLCSEVCTHARTHYCTWEMMQDYDRDTWTKENTAVRSIGGAGQTCPQP